MTIALNFPSDSFRTAVLSHQMTQKKMIIFTEQKKKRKKQTKKNKQTKKTPVYKNHRNRKAMQRSNAFTL